MWMDGPAGCTPRSHGRVALRAHMNQSECSKARWQEQDIFLGSRQPSRVRVAWNLPSIGLEVFNKNTKSLCHLFGRYKKSEQVYKALELFGSKRSIGFSPRRMLFIDNVLLSNFCFALRWGLEVLQPRLAFNFSSFYLYHHAGVIVDITLPVCMVLWT